MADEFMLTTVDNEFDPFTEFDAWQNRDEELGYFTMQTLGRVTFTSDSLSEKDNDLAIEEGMNKLISWFPLTYKKVFKKD